MKITPPAAASRMQAIIVRTVLIFQHSHITGERSSVLVLRQLPEALDRRDARAALRADHRDCNRHKGGEDETDNIEPGCRESVRWRIEDAGQQLDEHPRHAEAAREADRSSDAEDQQAPAPKESAELAGLGAERRQYRKAPLPVGQPERQDETR